MATTLHELAFRHNFPVSAMLSDRGAVISD